METDLQALERFVVENDDLLSLEAMIGGFNVFDALRIARAEIRHSNFLCWLLSPDESHGQGDRFLKAVLMDILSKARHQEIPPPLSAVRLDGAALEGVEIRREWRHIDLLIVCAEPRFVVAIENKIDCGEHSDQLKRYRSIVELEFPGTPSFFVFLVKRDVEPGDKGWAVYRYSDLHKTVSQARRLLAPDIGSEVSIFLDHYLKLIGTRFMKNEELDELCRRIYSRHRKALGLLWDRFGSPSSGLLGAIEDWLCERSGEWLHIATKDSFVEFIPGSWDAMLPPIARRSIIRPEHWMTIRLRVWPKIHQLSLHVVVGQTTDPIVRERLLAALRTKSSGLGWSIEGRKSGNQTDWRVHTVEICKLPKDDEPDPEQILPIVERKLTEFLEKSKGLHAYLARAL